MSETLLTLDEVMARLRVSRSMLYKLAKNDELVFVKLAGSTRIPQSSLDAYVEKVLKTALYKPAA